MVQPWLSVFDLGTRVTFDGLYRLMSEKEVVNCRTSVRLQVLEIGWTKVDCAFNATASQEKIQTETGVSIITGQVPTYK